MHPRARRFGPALGTSVVAHAGFVFVVLVLLSVSSHPDPAPVPPLTTKLVFMQQSGAAGGGGGQPRPAPPRPVEIPAHQRAVIVPVSASLPVERPPLPVLDALVRTDTASLLQATGTTLVALPGPGGGGKGRGLGSGDGPGVGPGTGGNTGGGPRRPGGDIIGPDPIYRARPQYTSAAMQAKLAGDVTLEVVVLADGTVGSARVVKSLDPVLGLDEQAIKAAKLWRFTPATQRGQPVDVLVTIILEFRIY